MSTVAVPALGLEARLRRLISTSTYDPTHVLEVLVVTPRDRLARLERNYPMVGATGVGWSDQPHVSGYRWFERTERVGTGRECWEFASSAVLTWGIKMRSGFRVVGPDGVRSDGQVVVPGSRHWLIAAIGPLHIREPVQIVSITTDPDRCGFAYGTLTGHPVSGEESFMVTRDGHDNVSLTIRSVSAPAGWWRLAFPGVVVSQWLYRRRYFRALVGEPAAPAL